MQLQLPREQPLNVVIVGHAEAGKSTLTSLILHMLGTNERIAVDSTNSESSWFSSYMINTNANLRAKLRTETIKMTHFDSAKRRYTILDFGHSRNMTVGAMHADVAILVVSVCGGEFKANFENDDEQFKGDALLPESLDVKHFVVAINKMDDLSVRWGQSRYEKCVARVKAYIRHSSLKIDIDNVKLVPISAITGDNVLNEVSESECGWWKDSYTSGAHNTNTSTLISTLDSLYVPSGLDILRSFGLKTHMSNIDVHMRSLAARTVNVFYIAENSKRNVYHVHKYCNGDTMKCVKTITVRKILISNRTICSHCDHRMLQQHNINFIKAVQLLDYLKAVFSIIVDSPTAYDKMRPFYFYLTVPTSISIMVCDLIDRNQLSHMIAVTECQPTYVKPMIPITSLTQAQDKLVSMLNVALKEFTTGYSLVEEIVKYTVLVSSVTQQTYVQSVVGCVIDMIVSAVNCVDILGNSIKTQLNELVHYVVVSSEFVSSVSENQNAASTTFNKLMFNMGSLPSCSSTQWDKLIYGQTDSTVLAPPNSLLRDTMLLTLPLPLNRGCIDGVISIGGIVTTNIRKVGVITTGYGMLKDFSNVRVVSPSNKVIMDTVSLHDKAQPYWKLDACGKQLWICFDENKLFQSDDDGAYKGNNYCTMVDVSLWLCDNARFNDYKALPSVGIVERRTTVSDRVVQTMPHINEICQWVYSAYGSNRHRICVDVKGFLVLKWPEYVKEIVYYGFTFKEGEHDCIEINTEHRGLALYTSDGKFHSMLKCCTNVVGGTQFVYLIPAGLALAQARKLLKADIVKVLNI